MGVTVEEIKAALQKRDALIIKLWRKGLKAAEVAEKIRRTGQPMHRNNVRMIVEKYQRANGLPTGFTKRGP